MRLMVFGDIDVIEGLSQYSSIIVATAQDVESAYDIMKDTEADLVIVGFFNALELAIEWADIFRDRKFMAIKENKSLSDYRQAAAAGVKLISLKDIFKIIAISAGISGSLTKRERLEDDEVDRSKKEFNKRKGFFKQVIGGVFSKTKAVEEDNKFARVLTVWNPTGSYKSFTALNISITLRAALLNFDLTCPELDVWFDIKQTSLKDASPKDAGVLTMCDALTPELLPNLLRVKKWGIRYLPAGNKLGNIGTPDIAKTVDDAKDLFKQLINKAKEDAGIVVIDAGRDFELPPTFAALSEADIIIIPVTTPQESEIVALQLKELARVGVEKPAIELVFNEQLKKVCKYRIIADIDYRQVVAAANGNTPHCLSETGQDWEKIVKSIKLINE
ncbi:hypothetical protein V6C27_13805 [Peptococcaceae bacterium 1198_IL3148]